MQLAIQGLAVVGIYSVMAYSVSLRTAEIGIRIALGAARHDIVKLLIRQAPILIACGILLGLIGSFALTQVVTEEFVNK